MNTTPDTRLLRHGFFEPTADQWNFMRYWQAELEKLPTEQILRWSVETFHPKLALVTSCGVGGSVLISMVGRMKLDVPVINADSGDRFGETKRLHERLEEKFEIRIITDSPTLGLPEQSFCCCGGKKLIGLRQKAKQYDAWISESRRDHSSDTVRQAIIDWDERFGLFRIAPLSRWTKQSIRNKAIRESIPFDEYSDQDYFDDDCHACLFSGKSGTTDAENKSCSTHCRCSSQ